MRQKKIFIDLALILLTVLLFIASPQITQAVIYSSLDQTCSIAYDNDSKVDLTSGGGSQFFTPTQNRLTKVVVKINGDGEGSLMSTIILDTDYVGFSDTVAEPDGLNKIVTFRFDSLALTPGTQYRLAILATYGNDFVEWQYKDVCYEGGDALVSSGFQDYDFIFATYGYTEETPPVETTEDSTLEESSASEPETTLESTENTPTSASTDNGSSNSSNSSESTVNDQQTSQNTPSNIKINKQGQVQEISTIEPPNDLVGEYRVSQINLKWQASKTADIDGYLIFRSEKETGDFQKISQVAGNQLNFLDTDLARPKQYFYYVKAFKDKEESSQTNTVEIQTFLINKLSNSSTKVAFPSQNQLTFIYLCLSIALLLLGYLAYRTVKYYQERQKYPLK